MLRPPVGLISALRSLPPRTSRDFVDSTVDKIGDAYPILWKRNGAPPLHGDGIRSSSDLSSGGDASGKTIGQVFVAVDAVVSNNTNELKTCISRSVSDRRVYACFAKGS